MREILFKAKETFNGEWVEGYYEFGYDAETEEPTHYMWVLNHTEKYGDMFMVIPETVGQYTGLTDRNGKKIFEGDIVNADDYIFCIKYGKCGGTQNAETYGYMGFYLEAVSKCTKICAKYGLRNDICYFKDILVIGNIHDNPELLN